MDADSRAGTVLDAVRAALEVMVVLVVATAALLSVVLPRLGGAVPFDVRTPSMLPGMPPGTLVVVRPVPPADIDVGSVITFLPRPGDPTVVTHRVVGQGFDALGRPVYRTQGDANDAPDPWTVRPDQVVGERWYSIPHLGRLTQLLTGRQREVGVYVVAGGLLAYAAVMMLGALRDRVRRPGVMRRA